MSPLMPEYERQLRAAAKRLGHEQRPAGSGSRILLTITAVVAVAAAAIILIGHHPAGSADSNGSGGLAQTQYDCGARGTLAPIGPFVTTAHGIVAGRRWSLQTDSSRRGADAVRAGRFLVDGHAYGICRGGLDVELIDAGQHGIVYGFATRPYAPPIVLEATTAHGTAQHPVPAYRYPAATRSVPGGTLFVRALPSPACAYRDLAVALPKAVQGGNSSQVTLLGDFARPCEPGRLVATPQQGSGPSTPSVAPPPACRHGSRRSSGPAAQCSDKPAAWPATSSAPRATTDRADR